MSSYNHLGEISLFSVTPLKEGTIYILIYLFAPSPINNAYFHDLNMVGAQEIFAE